MSRPPAPSTEGLPLGVALHRLCVAHDRAGQVVDLYDLDWGIDPKPLQWNLVNSEANSLRGVHVHTGHWDYLHVARGEMLLGLRDMRVQSATHDLVTQVRLRADEPSAIAIPPGVAHGFYFAGPTDYLYAMSHYWSPADELGCRWNDPELGIAWPTTAPLLSQRDRDACGYRELMQRLAAALARASS